MKTIHTITIPPVLSKELGGYERIAEVVLGLLDTQEHHGKDVECVYQDGDNLVLEFTSEGDCNFFRDMITQ